MTELTNTDRPMVPGSGKPLRQSHSWGHLRKRYSVRPFFSTLLVVGTIAAVVATVNWNPYNSRGLVLGVHPMHARRAVEIHEAVVTKNDASPPAAVKFTPLLTLVEYLVPTCPWRYRPMCICS